MNRLKMEVEPTFFVNARDLEKFIAGEYNLDEANISFIKLEGNDYHTQLFIVNPIKMGGIREFIKDYRVDAFDIMRDLCAEGKIPKGFYVVRVGCQDGKLSEKETRED